MKSQLTEKESLQVDLIDLICQIKDLKYLVERYKNSASLNIKAEKEELTKNPSLSLEMFVKGKIEANIDRKNEHAEILRRIKQIIKTYESRNQIS